MFKKALTASVVYCALTTNYAVADQLSVTVTNPNGSAVDTVIVYAEPLDFPPPQRAPRSIEVTQKEWAFTPFMSVAQRTDNVVFTNQDNFTHHIYSLTGSSRFSFKLKPGEESAFDTQRATAGDEIAMGCNIHDWMSGFMLLVDTPYFEQTNEQGTAELELEQSGRYKLTVWHPQLKTKDHKVSQVIEISGDKQVSWQLPKKLVVNLPQVSEDEFDFLDKY